MSYVQPANCEGNRGARQHFLRESIREFREARPRGTFAMAGREDLFVRCDCDLLASMKTIKQVALAVFHQPPESYNCAQAVLHGYREVSGDRETMPVVEMKAFGGGHAPGGFCGALHAACTVAPAKAEELHEKFARHMGSAICKELRAAKEKRCQDCVGTAAELLETELKSRDNLH